MGERIAKRLGRAGVCSRREGEALILAGKVSVNGVTLTTPAFLVEDSDVVVVDGKVVGDKEPTKLWRFSKPAGIITSHKDPEGRPTLFSLLPKDMPRVISVGRLDYNSEGLILLTNDGELARKLELPSTGWVRRYRVRAHGKVDAARLEKLAKGVTIEGISYGSVEVVLEREQGDNAWLIVSLKEGKNREVRKLMEHVGLIVNRLIRVSYGPFQLGNLETGAIAEVSGKVLNEQMGEKVANNRRKTPGKAT